MSYRNGGDRWGGFKVVASLLLAIAFSGSCSTTIEPNIDDLGYQYFPLQSGSYRDYQVEEIIYNFAGTIDTLNYFLRESIGAEIGDSQPGEVTLFFVNRFSRSALSENWKLDSVWSAYQSEFSAVLKEQNLPRIKLVFPFSEGRRWDSNSLSSVNEDFYEMHSPHRPASVGSFDFDRTVWVVQEELLDSLIFFDHRVEMYAEEVGLVKKLDSRLKFCQDNDCFGQRIIEEGRQFNMELIDFGVE